MAEEYGCERARVLLVELATGVLTGHERGQVLHHVAGCAACRGELAALAQVADSLLLLAPTAEPPAGFEGRLIARLERLAPAQPEGVERAGTVPAGVERAGTVPAGVERAGTVPAGVEPGRPVVRRGRPDGPGWWRRRLTRPALAVAAAVLVAGGLGGAVVEWRNSGDHALAERYRQTLAIADGRYLEAARLTTAGGTPAGTVFLYQGRASWLLASVTAAPADGVYAMTVFDRNGVAHPMGFCAVAGGTGTTGYALDIPVTQIAAVQLLGPAGERLAADI